MNADLALVDPLTVRSECALEVTRRPEPMSVPAARVAAFALDAALPEW